MALQNFRCSAKVMVEDDIRLIKLQEMLYFDKKLLPTVEIMLVNIIV